MNGPVNGIQFVKPQSASSQREVEKQVLANMWGVDRVLLEDLCRPPEEKITVNPRSIEFEDITKVEGRQTSQKIFETIMDAHGAAVEANLFFTSQGVVAQIFEGDVGEELFNILQVAEDTEHVESLVAGNERLNSLLRMVFEPEIDLNVLKSTLTQLQEQQRIWEQQRIQKADTPEEILEKLGMMLFQKTIPGEVELMSYLASGFEAADSMQNAEQLLQRRFDSIRFIQGKIDKGYQEQFNNFARLLEDSCAALKSSSLIFNYGAQEQEGFIKLADRVVGEGEDMPKHNDDNIASISTALKEQPKFILSFLNALDISNINTLTEFYKVRDCFREILRDIEKQQVGQAEKIESTFDILNELEEVWGSLESLERGGSVIGDIEANNKIQQTLQRASGGSEYQIFDKLDTVIDNIVALLAET
jgi:hypothetical protein